MSMENKDRKILRKLAIVDSVLANVFGDENVEISKVGFSDPHFNSEMVYTGYQISVTTHSKTVYVVGYNRDKILRMSTNEILDDIADAIYGDALKRARS